MKKENNTDIPSIILRYLTIAMLLAAASLIIFYFGEISEVEMKLEGDSLANNHEAFYQTEMYATDGWYYWEDGYIRAASLPADIQTESDSLSLYRQIAPNEGNTIMLKCSRLGLTIEAQGKVIAELNNTKLADRLLVSAQKVGTLPVSDEKYLVKVTFTGFKNGVCSVPEIYIGSGYGAMGSAVGSEALTVVNIILFLVLGIILLAVMVYFKAHGFSADFRIGILGLFLVCAALWALTDSALALFIPLATETVTFLDYLFFMIMPIPIVYFLRNTLKPEKKLFSILGIISISNIVLQTALSMAEIIHLNSMLIITHIEILCTIVFGLGFSIRHRKESAGPPYADLLFKSLIELSVTTAIALIVYWLIGGAAYRAVMLSGIFIFCIMLMTIIVRSYLERDKKSREEIKKYEEISLVDSMTGLNNRRAYEQKTESIENGLQEGINAILVMMDLNNLKLINDRYGHEKGDELLNAAGKCILEAFGLYGSCYRIGGDEFSVIIDNSDADINDIIKAFNNTINEYNKANPAEEKLSIAVGYSVLRSERRVHNSITSWRQEADAKMYVEKQKMHVKREDSEKQKIDSLAECLITIQENRIDSMKGHSERVAKLCGLIAAWLYMPENEINAVVTAGKMHDIGKLGIEGTTEKRDNSNTENEYHARIGSEIVSKISGMEQIAQSVLYHHEAWNGSGFPEGLTGGDIPLFARIVSVADSIDAVFKDSISPEKEEQCRTILEEGKGVLFDPDIITRVFDNWDELTGLINNNQ